MSEEKVIVGRYRLGDLIGRGGMGDVYRGVDTVTGDPVAIKLLHHEVLEENPNLLDRFQREGEALGQLNHPNIVAVLDMVEDDGQHYLIMEYVGGGSLRDLLDRNVRLPIDRILNIALDLCDALTRAHRLQIVHRDIKPDNVLLAEDGTPRLTDFGVAHLGGRSRLTQTGSVIGTYAYLSPEACNGLPLDERTDIWSLGVMLYELLAGRPPFEENSTAAILTAILTKPAPDLTRLREDMPPALADLIAGMLEKDRDRRISSVRLVGAELEAMIRGLDTPSRVLMAGSEGAISSRFATPASDTDHHIPAMDRGTPPHTHGLPVYPTGYESDQDGPRRSFWKEIGALAALVAIVALAAFLLIPRGGSDDDSPTGAGDQRVEPVAPGEYMVLVAQLEQLGPDKRDVTRFIVDDLTQTLEVGVPFSAIRIREYPGVIASDEAARAAAETNGATIVIWGNYTADLIELDVQMGVTTAFPYITFDREVLERTANLRVHMTDERSESVAPYVIGILGVLEDADGDAFEAMRVMAIMDLVDVTPAQVVGNTVAAQLNHAFDDMLGSESIGVIDAAIEIDPGNPILYTYRNIANQRLGNIDEASRDAETALRLGPPNWAMPLLLKTNASENLSEVMAVFAEIIRLRPDDWYVLFLRASIYYEAGEYRLARNDLERALALKPTANFPYVLLALVELREGNLSEAAALMGVILTEFPDPSFMNRLITATFGDKMVSGQAVILSSFGNLVLGRYDVVVDEAQAGLEMYQGYVDLYVLQGFAYCALSDYKAAEKAYSMAIQFDPNFMLAHMQRGEVRLKQRNYSGAAADFNAIAYSDMADKLDPYVKAIRNGELGCGNFFDSGNPMLQIMPPAPTEEN